MDRGICNAWLWPLDKGRLCLPWRPIPLQGIPLFGWLRLKLELHWIGPLMMEANAGMLLRWNLKNNPGRMDRSTRNCLAFSFVDPISTFDLTQWRVRGVL